MSYTSKCTVMSKIWETEMNFFDFSHRHQPVEKLFLGLVAEPASPAKAGCLSGPAGLGGKIHGITSLRITCNL